MNKYQSYKPSGIEWIGEIPEGWSMTKLGFLGKLKSGNGFSEHLQGREFGGDYPFFKVSDTNNEGNEMYLVRSNNYVTSDDYIENKWYLFPKDTVIFPKIGMVLLMNKRRILKQPSFIDNNMMGFIPKSGIHSLFSFYLLKLIDFKNYCSDGTVPSIGESQISSIKVVLPTLPEQHQIVQFLDSKTELIDKLISTKERKITLLKEQRTSLINQVVTKGLNPNVIMKDSGVEWIGEIPEHWGIRRLKYLCHVSTGNRDTQDKIEDGEYPFYVRSPNIERINSYSFDGESVLTVGDGVGTGKVFHYVTGKFEFHQRVYKFSYFKNIIGKYFFEFIKVKFIYVTEDQNSKSTVDSLRRPLIDNFIFCLPPINEQNQIVEFLDSKTKEIDDLVKLEQKKIDLLKEYRQSLISEVVTGKIKVTN